MSEVKPQLYTYSLEMINLIEEIKALGVNPKQGVRLDELENIAKGIKDIYDNM